MLTSLQTGHFIFELADLSPSNINTDPAEQAHALQKICPQLKAYGWKTVFWSHCSTRNETYGKYAFSNLQDCIWIIHVPNKSDTWDCIANLHNQEALISIQVLNLSQWDHKRMAFEAYNRLYHSIHWNSDKKPAIQSTMVTVKSPSVQPAA